MRVAPDSLKGHWPAGPEVTVTLAETTLVVAVKADCDGCRDFLNADLNELGVAVLVISRDDAGSSEWIDAKRPVLVSPEAFQLLDIRWPPFYVLVDPIAGRVLTEGVLFGPSQVAAEIASYLRD